MCLQYKSLKTLQEKEKLLVTSLKFVIWERVKMTDSLYGQSYFSHSVGPVQYLQVLRTMFFLNQLSNFTSGKQQDSNG